PAHRLPAGRGSSGWSVRGGPARLILTGLVAVGLLAATGLVYLDRRAPPHTAAAPDGRRWGRTLFLAKGCNGCHTLQGLPGRAQIGPDLSGLATRAGERAPGLTAEEYVRQSIRAPQAFMVPEFRGGFARMPTLPLGDAEVEALVAFLLSPDELSDE
ncbi:MAG: cytochrome c, partial [Actinomycetota bacterium]|nr:cytochrome c [Actinomycetota bacterium]